MLGKFIPGADGLIFNRVTLPSTSATSTVN